ncbi:MAG: SEC-C domain-containing protein [Chloroflexi bacterium]|nr:SEC-C domain-containing protein [Chloroflexota bacterium]
MFKNIIKAIGGDPNKRDVRKYTEVVDQINDMSRQFEDMSDDALRAKSDELRGKVQAELGEIPDDARLEERKKATQATLDSVLPEAFALVRETSARTIGLRHYDVQLIGGMVLHAGRIAEMQTGEGKTLVATLPLYLNALTGRGVHLVTVNDYLARRDAKWMGPLYHALGLSVGILQDASRTENARKAFVFDPARDSSQEDSRFMRIVERGESYACDIVYGTNNEFGFDYLRDNMATSLAERRQRQRYFAIVDEVDNILIDEARTPLIISGPSGESAALYQELARAVKVLKPEHYEIDERGRSLALNDEGYQKIEEALGRPLRDPDRPEDLTPEQATTQAHLEQAMRAEFIFKKNKDYLVQGGHVVIVDEHTGRVMPGRRWSDGLHQAVEAKEGVPVQPENVTYATITLQNFFRLYDKLAGMSGTALTEAEEFDKIYKLDVVPIPKNVEYRVQRDPNLIEREIRENGYKFSYLARKSDPDKPVWYRRKDYPDSVFRTEESKLRAIMWDALWRHVPGQPLLIGTTSVESSEQLSKRFSAEPLRRLALVNLLRDRWFKANNAEEDGRAVPALQPFNKPLDSLNPSDMRPLAKELNMTLNPIADENLTRLCELLFLDSGHKDRLRAVLESGIKHRVLNAKKHDEESQIILGAGKLGAVTIATNMAGRGVDIKLGGDFDETMLIGVNRVLERAGHANAFEMRHDDRLAALDKISPDDYSIYAEQVVAFRQHMADEQTVRAIGGLHVVGSERHDARRIDNQLRGRAARQGDPGSSRFYLSLEDDLMRRFGGANVSGLMERLTSVLKVDDALPIEHGIVDKTVEGSQQRVEGYNFDIRKHLLEYDDVLNQQRTKIYEQRDRIFTKEDLTDDIDEMLVAEVARRVDMNSADEDRWKLLAWLDEVQPVIQRADGSLYFPFSIELILSRFDGLAGPAQVKDELLTVAKGASDSARDQLVTIVETQLETYPARVKERVDAKREAADNAFDNARDLARDQGQPLELRNVTREMLEAAEISNLPLRKEFFDGQTDRTLKKAVGDAIEAAIGQDAAIRFLKWAAARIGLDLKVTLPAWSEFDWDGFGDLIREAVIAAYDARTERHLSEISTLLDERLRSAADVAHDALGRLLLDMAVGQSVTFNKKTHRRETRLNQRFPYVYYAAGRLEDRKRDDLLKDILAHLRTAQEEQQLFWGESELTRLSPARPAELDADTQVGLRRALGEADFEAIASQNLGSLNGTSDLRDRIRSELGRQLAHGLHRQLMLGVSGQLWVDYLTTIEGLRTSISLEAYAQRDPLIAYKSKAFDLFQQLLVDMRAGVVGRLFTYRPRKLTEVRAEVERQASESPKRALGRNDPCWCGSGKKYKNCHMAADGKK